MLLAGTPRADLPGHRPLDPYLYAGHLLVLRIPLAGHNCEVNPRPTTPGFRSSREAEPAMILRTRPTSIRTSSRSGNFELEFEGDIEPMEGQTDSDPDDWQDVTHRKCEGKACK